jgi:phosphoglycolate phosphatase
MLHVAPEKALSLKIKGIVGEGYVPADYDPSRYTIDGLTVSKIDLTRMHEFDGASFDLILHLHVLEHIPIDLGQLLIEHIRVLKPGGRFIFALPIGPGITYENIWPDATPDERKERFGQHDHFRLVGKLDFPRFLKRVAGAFTGQDDFRINPDDHMERQEFEQSGLAYSRVMDYTGDTLFEIVKPIPSG